jgi:hypothetical protein
MTAEIRDMVAVGGKVAIGPPTATPARGGFTLGMAATGETFAMNAIYLVRISEQGHTAEHRDLADGIVTMGQVGPLSTPGQAPA